MTLTAHVSVACAVGLATQNPVAGFFAGFISHHIIDGIPHSDAGSLGANVYNLLKNKTLKYVIADVVIAAIFFAATWLRYNFSPLIFWSALGGALPDLIDNSPFWSKYTRKIFPTNYYHKFHETFHFTILSKRYFWVGIATQVVLILIAVGIIYK